MNNQATDIIKVGGKEVTVAQMAAELIDSHGYEQCDICIHRRTCSRGVTNGPNGPSYPACTDLNNPCLLADKAKVLSIIEENEMEEARRHD